MEKKFGNTDISFFPLGLGTIWMGRRWPPYNKYYINPSIDEIDYVLKDSFKRMANADGVVMLDTAAAYGKCEEHIGRFLKNNPNENAKAFIATKWGEYFNLATERSAYDHSINNLRKSFARSVKYLGHIELLYIHGTTLEVLQDKSVIDELKSMKKKHMIKFIGASISNKSVLEKSVRNNLLNSFDVIQMPADLVIKLPDIFNKIYEQGKAIIINSPIRKSGSNISPQEQIRKFAFNPKISVLLIGTRYHFNETLNYLNE